MESPTITVDFRNSELVKDILDTLQHVAETTTCEATKVYLAERLDYLTSQ